MTGLSVDVLRAWERRYDAVTPRRDGGGRRYTEADVRRLRQLSALAERGHAIGSIAGLTDKQLARLLGARARRPVAAAPGGAPSADLAAIAEALDRYDLDAIETRLNGYAAVLPIRDLIFTVILPVLRHVGERWEAGTLRPAQEHLISAIVRSVIGSLLRTATRPQGTPRLICATPAGERHELGLLSAALLAGSEGCGVLYLGPDLPVADIWYAAAQANAAIVLVGLTVPGAVPPRELRLLAAPPAGVHVWVGGPAASDVLSLRGRRCRHIETIDALPAAIADVR